MVLELTISVVRLASASSTVAATLPPTSFLWLPLVGVVGQPKIIPTIFFFNNAINNSKIIKKYVTKMNLEYKILKQSKGRKCVCLRTL